MFVITNIIFADREKPSIYNDFRVQSIAHPQGERCVIRQGKAPFTAQLNRAGVKSADDKNAE